MKPKKVGERKSLVKRGASVLLTFLLLSGTAFGCASRQENAPAGSDSSETAKEESLAPGRKYTVQFWHSVGGNNLEYLKPIISSFNSTHQDIQVTATYQGSYSNTQTKLENAIASGTAPDVSMLERSNVQYFADADALEDLTSYLESSSLKDDFVPGLMGHSKFNGKLVSLPFNRSEPVMYVNRTLLDQMGLKAPDTWEDLRKVSDALVKKAGNEYKRYGFSMPFDTWYPIAMLTQCGGKFFNDEGTDVGYDDGQMEKVFNFLQDSLKSGALYMPPAKGGGDRIIQMFASGELGIVFQSTGTYGQISKTVNGKFDVQMCYLPKDEKRANPTGGGNIVIPAKAQNKAAAWEFIQWMMTDAKGLRQFIIKSGYLPPTNSMAQSSEIQELWKKDPNLKVAFDQLQFAVDTNKSTNWPLVDKDIQTAMSAIYYDRKDVKSTLETFKAAAKKDLTR